MRTANGLRRDGHIAIRALLSDRLGFYLWLRPPIDLANEQEKNKRYDQKLYDGINEKSVIDRWRTIGFCLGKTCIMSIAEIYKKIAKINFS